MALCDWYHPRQHFDCQQPGVSSVQDELIGCEVGCLPCRQSPGGVVIGPNMGVSVHGERYVQFRDVREDPDSRGRQSRVESRHADGIRRNIPSGVPVRLTRFPSYFSLSNCWANGGSESYDNRRRPARDSDRCACRQTHQLDRASSRQGLHSPCGGNQPCSPLTGRQPTCEVFTGFNFPPSSMRCFGEFFESEEQKPIVVGFTPGRFDNVAMVRTGNCTSNYGALLWGHSESSACVEADTVQPFYHNNHRAWDFCRVLGLSGRFGTDARYGAAAAADIRAANKALAYIETQTGTQAPLGLGQLSSARRFDPDAVNNNGELDHWFVTWNQGRAFPDREPLGLLPSVMDCQCRLANAGTSLTVRYAVNSVSIRMSMILHTINQSDPCGLVDNRIFPYAKARVEIFMQPVVVEALEGPVSFDWTSRRGEPKTTTVENVYAGWPVVSRGDRILYADDTGQPVRLRPRILWEGEVGAFSSVTPTANVDTDRTGRVATWCSIARGLDPFVIGALDSHQQNRPEGHAQWRHTGDLTIEFPHEIFASCP